MATTATPGLASSNTRPAEARAVRVGALALLLTVAALISVLWIDGEPLLGWPSLPWLALVFLASVLPVGEQQGSPYLALDLPILLACSFVLGPAAAGHFPRDQRRRLRHHPGVAGRRARLQSSLEKFNVRPVMPSR